MFALDFIIECANDSQDQMFVRSTVLDFTDKKVALLFIAHKGYGRKPPECLIPK